MRSDDPAGLALTSLLLSEVASASRLPTGIRMPTSDWLLEWAVPFLDGTGDALPAGFSRRTAERAMLAETGLTLGQWCRQARSLRGLRALSEGSPVQEAALAAGFETSSGFIQSFRRQFGATPGRMFPRGGRLER